MTPNNAHLAKHREDAVVGYEDEQTAPNSFTSET